MSDGTVVLAGGQRVTGRIIEWLGDGLVLIESNGLRQVGALLEAWQRRHPADVETVKEHTV